MRNLVLNNVFTCLRCRQIVPVYRAISGVHNRNHCPYCLWSRHLDLEQPGDRMSACKAGMRPLGLALKQTAKKYNFQGGELMIIHQCIECGQVSINRIAADDIAENLFEIYLSSLQIDRLTCLELETQGIQALQAADDQLVQSRLFGVN